MKDWKTIKQLAKYWKISEAAARRRAKKYTDVGAWERAKRGRREILAFRDQDLSFPSHSGKDERT